MQKTKGIVMRFFYFLLIVLLGIIIVLSISKPQHNLINWQMALLSGAMGISVIFFAFFLERFCKNVSDHILKKVKIVMLAFLFISFFIVGCVMRNKVDSLGDYGFIYESARELAEGTPLDAQPSANYFRMYSNNIVPTVFLSKIMKFSALLKIRDPYYLVLFVGVAISGAAICSALFLAEDQKKNYGLSFFLIVLFAALLPLWIVTPALYTDQMSFCFAIGSLALLKAGFASSKPYLRGIFCALSGFLFAMGIYIKVTVLIPLIAALIVFLFVEDIRRRAGKCFAIWFISLSLAAIGLAMWLNSQEIAREARITEDPVTAWIGLGIQGDGSYQFNMSYVDYVHALPTKEEKKQFIKEYIADNKAQFINAGHLMAKVRCNFASGFLGTKDYIFYAESGYENHFLWELCSPYGKYYRRGSQYTFGFIFAVYLIYFAGAVLSLVRLLKKGSVDPLVFLIDISFVGYFLFLMLWEANNRQLYNFVPLLLLGGYCTRSRFWRNGINFPDGKKVLALEKSARLCYI